MTTVVKVIVWVLKTVVVPVIETVCIFTTFIIGSILLPFAAAIDAVCATCNTTVKIKAIFITPAKITFVSKAPSNTKPSYWDYVFVCNCSPFKKETIKVEASNDEQAAALAKIECEKQCG